MYRRRRPVRSAKRNIPFWLEQILSQLAIIYDVQKRVYATKKGAQVDDRIYSKGRELRPKHGKREMRNSSTSNWNNLKRGEREQVLECTENPNLEDDAPFQITKWEHSRGLENLYKPWSGDDYWGYLGDF